MKVKLTGRFLEDIKPLILSKGFDIVEENPDVVITHGGDGTLLGAERKYPGLLKLPIRDTRTASLCDKHSYDSILDDLKSNSLKKVDLMKLAGESAKLKVIGINDVFIHNVDRVGALRYRVWIDDELYAREVVGDAVGVATVHGSTAYYRSITHSIFRIGIGLAFSNSMEVTNHLVLPEKSMVKIEILRGPALLVADNGVADNIIKDGEFVSISKHHKKAHFVGLDTFMCPQCRRLRHSKQ